MAGVERFLIRLGQIDNRRTSSLVKVLKPNQSVLVMTIAIFHGEKSPLLVFVTLGQDANVLT